MSSKLLAKLALLPAKALVTGYTWATLPLYTALQRPWRKLKLSKSFNIRATTDAQGRVVYSRTPPVRLDHPQLACTHYNELLEGLDRSHRIFGVREVLSEVLQVDEATGRPIKVDGRELKKIKLADAYRWYTVGEVLDRVDALARGLQAMGVGEQEKVVIYAENSFEWFVASVALLRINATTVTLLSILNDEGILYGLNQCQARYAIVSQELLARLARIAPSISTPLNVTYIPNQLTPPSDDPQVAANLNSLKSCGFTLQKYDEVQEAGRKLPPAPFPASKPEDIALIMYTSGTTGNPKGVMLTTKNLLSGHKNLIAFDEELQQVAGTSILNSRYPAYLPMAHLYGFVINHGLFVSKARIGLCSPLTMLESSPGNVPGQVADFALIKPNFIGGVPLVLDRILKEIYRKLEARNAFAPLLFTYLMDYKIRWTSRGYDTPIINKVVCQRINDQFGGQLQTIICGSAALNERTQAYIQAALNLKLIQGYGSTEMTAASHLMAPSDLNYGECGTPLLTFKFYLKDWAEGGYYTTDKPNPRGEIVAGGDCITAGYYHMPEETAECYKVDPDGTRWFESGDIVEVLPDRTLKVIDRRKDLTKLYNGEFVSLGKIESGLRSSPVVENICVCTHPHSNHVTAIVSPNRRALADLAASLGKSRELSSFEEQCTDPDIIAAILRSFDEIGQKLSYSRKELPVTITLVEEEWSQDNGLLTAAMKMKRKQVNDFYRTQIAEMFERTNEKSQY
ncbi:Long-chain-fatty-acid--CoA ligase 4 [Tyrophagus putrescentiae]|nr:Long-chain-fatty-acid--CoA ligase 4 [Tyrophagus putrescentiae]